MLRLPGPLVSVDWLAARLTDPGLRVADVRWSLAGPPGADRYPATTWSPGQPDDDLVGTDDVTAMLGGETLLLDARAGERYRGETEPIDPRAGHIPGAVSAPFAANLAPDGRFLPAEALRARYDSLGAGERSVVAYCGSSLSAAHDLLALELAGIHGSRLYEGSWSDWSSDPARPVATGAMP